MNRTENFARILINELVEKDKSKGDVRISHKRNGIDSSNLNDADEIWKLFVRYNLDSGGMKSKTVEDNWNTIPNHSILKQRKELVQDILALKQKFISGPLDCYSNLSENCPMTFSNGSGFKNVTCLDVKVIDICPVVEITKEIGWHRMHYKIAKIVVECARRLLIEDNIGKQNGNLNDVVFSIFNDYKYGGDDWKTRATKELILRFDNIKGYGRPPKVIIWMLSELSSPVHQVNHWPDVDLSQLTPVDTHVQRLMVRFGFLPSNLASAENINRRLNELYPEEPRNLDFALYRLGGELEESICRKDPDCKTCGERFPNIYKECPNRNNESHNAPGKRVA